MPAAMTKVSVELIKMIPALDGLRENPIARAAVDILVHLAELAGNPPTPAYPPEAVSDMNRIRAAIGLPHGQPSSCAPAAIRETREALVTALASAAGTAQELKNVRKHEQSLRNELAMLKGDLVRADEALQAARRVNEQGVTQKSTYENALASAEKAKREAVASWSTMHATAARAAATYRAAMIRALFGDAYESDDAVARCTWTDVMIIDEVRARLAAKASVGAKLIALIDELRGAL